MRKINLSFLVLSCIFLLGSLGLKAQDPVFNPDAGKLYRIFCADPEAVGFAFKGSSYVSYKEGISEDQLIQFEQVGEEGEYLIYIKNSNVYFHNRSGALNSQSDKASAQKYKMQYAETIDGIVYYNFNLSGGSRYLRFSGGNVRNEKSLGTTLEYKLAILEDGQIFKKGLIDIINVAVELQNTTEVGTETGKYPEAARLAFDAAVSTAQSELELSSATQESIDAAASALETAIILYQNELIVPEDPNVFNPDPEKRYVMYCAVEGKDDWYAYLSDYVRHKEGLSEDNFIKFEKDITRGQWHIYLEKNDCYFGDRDKCLDTQKSKSSKTTYIMEYVETIDGVKFYNYKQMDSGRYLRFDSADDAKSTGSCVRGDGKTLTNADCKIAIREITDADLLEMDKAKLSVVVESAEAFLGSDVNIPPVVKTIFVEKINTGKTLLESTDPAQIESVKTLTSELETLSSQLKELNEAVAAAKALSEKETLPVALKEALKTTITNALAITTVEQIADTTKNLKNAVANAEGLESVISEASALKEKDNVPAAIKTLLDEAIQAALQVEPGEPGVEDPVVTELKELVVLAAGLESGITTASGLVYPEGYPTVVNGKLSSSVTEALAVSGVEQAKTVLTGLDEVLNINQNLIKAIVDAREALSKQSAGGFGEAEKTNLNNALTAVLGISSYDATVISAAIETLNNATKTYLDSEKEPSFTPLEGVKYRIVATSDVTGIDGVMVYNGSNVRLSVAAVPTGDQVGDFEFEAIEGTNPVAYYIKVSGTEDYIIQDGAASSDNMKAKPKMETNPERSRWNVTYAPQTINGNAYFTIFNLQSRGLKCPTELNANIVRSSSINNRDKWRIIKSSEYVGGELAAMISEAEELLASTTAGTEAGQYLKADRDALEAAKATAEKVLEEGDSDAIAASVSELHEAMETYKLAKLADRTVLQNLIEAAQARLNETTEGTKPGEFLPDTRAELQGSINLAKNVLAAEVLTQVEADAAVADLQTALDTYNSLENLSIDTSRVYYLQGKGGNYLGRENEGEGTRVTTRGNNSSATDVYPITLTRVVGKANVYNIRRYPSGEYLANPSSYAVYFQSGDLGDTEATNVQLFEIADGYLLIKFLRNAYFGANNTDANQNTASNKDDGNASQWKLVENKKLSLAYMISLAEALVAEDYTSLTWASFEPALAAAKALSEEATDDEIEAVMGALQNAMDGLVNISALRALVATAEALVETDYIGSTWSALQEVLAQAQSLLESAANQAEVNNAVNQLQAAVDSLINIADLQRLVDSSKALKAEDYAPVSWEALQTGIADAEAILLSATSQDEVDSAISALQTIVNNLVSLVNLKDRIADVEASELNESDYSVASWKVLSDALTVAEGVMINAETQNEVNNALSTLTASINGLIDVISLKETIASGKDFVESDYTTVSWTAYTTALGTANTAIETAVSESTVVNAKSALDAAIKGLVNVKDLRALVTTAKEKKEADYTAESWSAFKSALNAAESALETAANQAAVDVAKVALQKAMDDLALKTGIDELQSAGVDMYVSGQTLYVTGLSDQVVISGYDVSGRMIFTEQVSEATFTRELPVGNYVITIKGYVNGSRVIISR